MLSFCSVQLCPVPIPIPSLFYSILFYSMLIPILLHFILFHPIVLYCILFYGKTTTRIYELQLTKYRFCKLGNLPMPLVVDSLLFRSSRIVSRVRTVGSKSVTSWISLTGQERKMACQSKQAKPNFDLRGTNSAKMQSRQNKLIIF